MSEIMKKALTDKSVRNSEALRPQKVAGAPWL